MLVHICCSVDSHYFLKKLREKLPNEPLTGFFYNPNIHPYEEYMLRLADVKRSCNKYNIKLICGEYDVENWLKIVKGLECEKERGKRCEVCFEMRLEVTAKKAKELGERSITTTLFMSPKKSFEQLEEVSSKVACNNDLDVLCFDFRKGGGTNEQFKLSREDRLYHQNYCGCIYALSDQRAAKNRVVDELINPIGKEILQGSILERIKLYKNVRLCEKNAKEFKIEKERFQNYRLLWGLVSEDGRSVHSYFIGKYEFGDKSLEVKIEEIKNGFGFTESHIMFLSLKCFNEMAHKSYNSVKDLIFNPITPQEHLGMECKLFDYLLVIVLDEIKKTTYKIEAKSTSYQDVREVLAIL
ncbi:MAG: epoxyqueuosine reductase QueH [Campylobacteraceae bacterium]|jgi:predicted adenine nucleotide alpha hydrolase (AANH) superfamily ATPase|nr:epoxyqueuosine reductase QueH [Campylobacteraceae bacterium]